MREQIAEYLERVRQTKAENTYLTYAQSLNLFGEWCINDAFGKQDVLSVSNDDLQAFAQSRRAAGDGARTVFNRFLHVCIFLRAMGHRNLPKRSSFPRKVERLPEEYNGKQLTALLNAATPGERLILELFMCSGMRNQEVANLHVADCDFDESVIRVQAKGSWQPKGGREREIAIPRWLSEKLNIFRTENKLTGLVFPSANGTVDRNLLRIVKGVAERAKLSGRVDVHKFRSTAICQMLRSGYSLQDTMSTAGHNDLATVKRYLAVASRSEMQKKSERAFAFAGEQGR